MTLPSQNREDLFSLWSTGVDAMRTGNIQLGIDCYTKLTEQDPDEPTNHWTLGMALLAAGDYVRGFEEIEWRWHADLNGNEHDLALQHVPRWRGEDLTGKSIVLFHEWGLGDSIMMLRYLPIVRAMALSTTVVLPKPLHRLLPSMRVVEQVSPDERFDYRCSLYSLPPIFGVLPAPYLSVEVTGPMMAGYNVGIAWSGSKDNARDGVRSVDLRKFLELIRFPPGHNVFSLQTTDLKDAHPLGVKTPALSNFADTAAVIQMMDCVVTVDTASAHIAGAIGHPNAHVLLDYAQDWRWYRGKDWYPTLNMHRQKSIGDWESAFASARKMLAWRTMC